MRRFIYSLMTDRRKGVWFEPFKFILYLLSLIYAGGLAFRRFFYRVGIFKSARLPLKIISVGNLTLGGTGKTPFVIMLAKLLKNEMSKEPCVLLRGWGWDEQNMLKNNLSDIPVFVSENRVKSALRAVRLYGSRIGILDDGFQYWELKRDLDIVLVDSRNPFGNGQLFPRGVLREKRDSIIRADCVAFTKVNKKGIDIEEVKGAFKNVNSSIIFLEAVHRPKYFYDMKTKKTFDLNMIKRKRVILLSSIGDPEYFEETIKDLGADVIEHLIYPDHHNYRPKDMEFVTKRCNERMLDLLLTTEKDAVKLARLHLAAGNYGLMVLAVEMEITSGREALIARLYRLYTG